MEITGENITAESLWKLSLEKPKLRLATTAATKMRASHQYVQARLKGGDVIYGVNTGFGAFSNVRISDGDILKLQQNLIRSHCCGIGSPFTLEETRAIMVLRANALARGHSGIRVEVVEKILEFLNQDVLPVIPSQGSVGASGDLAPLAHLALAMTGEGKIWKDCQPSPAASVLRERGIKPLELHAKEGLSLINGCQVMTAVGLLSSIRARRLLWLMDLAGAMSLEALRGGRSAFDPVIFATRPHPGEAKTARNLNRLLGKTSPIGESHVDCNRVQDAYSLRCMPAVHGAAKDALRTQLAVLEIEANSSTDNPLVFVEEEKILSCGNFHGEPVAFALDFMAIAMAAASSMSECRIEKMINPSMSSLPAFLAPNGGLNSGLMIVQVAAAALVSENKILTHPASVDSIPTSADKEDHVSMGTIAARKFRQVIENVENIVAMEVLTACQALDLLKPLEPAGVIKGALAMVRQQVPFAAEDRVFSDDIEAIRELICSEKLLDYVHKTVGELEW